MNIIFQINGGIGKCVMASAVCEAIKKQYPDSKLIVVSGYAEVFLNNPHVYRAFTFGNFSYFYDEYIDKQEFVVFAHDPYLETKHIKQEEHLIETWCKLYNIPYNNEQPKIYLTDREKNFFANKFNSDKPILLMQTNGGADSNLKYSWARDIPYKIVTQVIEEFKTNYNIIHIKRDDQLSYEHTYQVSDNFKALCVLISMSNKRLFMDSFAQHVAAGMNLPSTVLWIANKPNVFGYEVNNNIVCNEFTIKPELRNAYLGKFNIGGDILEFPYNNEDEIFNIKDVIDSINKF